VPTDLDPNNQTRSDARRTYFDPYASRRNMHIITGQHVTNVLIENVAADPVLSNPSSGGNTNGNGAAPGGTDHSNGFGFGPQGSTPPLGGRSSSSFIRRDTSASLLGITGVEVRMFTCYFDRLANLPISLPRTRLRRVRLSTLREKSSLLLVLCTRRKSYNCPALDPHHYCNPLISLLLWICPGLAITCRTIVLWAPSIHVSPYVQDSQEED